VTLEVMMSSYDAPLLPVMGYVQAVSSRPSEPAASHCRRRSFDLGCIGSF